MRPARLSAIALVGALCGPAAGAQSTGTIRGTVIESASGAPVIGARVAASCAGCLGRHPTDSAGRYVISRVPAGATTVEFNCPSRTLLGRHLTQQQVVVVPGTEVVLDIRVPPDACAEPPYSEQSGIFRGHYTPGFESSQFVPCPDRAVGLGGGLLPGQHLGTPSAWAVWTPAARAQRMRWPRPPRDRRSYPTYFVVWRGTLAGPGMYGHMGVSAFEFRVDSVLEVRLPRRDDCRAR